MKHSRKILLLSCAALLSACSMITPAPVAERTPSSAPAAPAAAAREAYVVRKGDTLYSIAKAHGMDHRELAAMNNIENPSRIFVGQQLRVRGAAPAGGEVVAQPVASASPVVEQRPLDGAPSAPAAASSNTGQLKVEPKAGKVPYSEDALAQAQREQSGAPLMAKAEPRPEPKMEPRTEPKPAAEPSAGADDVPWIWPANGSVVGQFSESGSKGVGIAGKAGDPVVAAGDGKVVYSGTGLRGYGQLIIVKHNATFLSAYAHNQRLLVKEGQAVSRGQKIAEMGNTDADQVKLHFEIRRQGKPVDPLKYLPQR